MNCIVNLITCFSLASSTCSPTRIILGSVPTEITRLSNLKILSLASNPSLDGTPLPAELGNMDSLFQLSLDGVAWSGGLPSGLASMDALRKSSNAFFFLHCLSSFLIHISHENHMTLRSNITTSQRDSLYTTRVSLKTI